MPLIFDKFLLNEVFFIMINSKEQITGYTVVSKLVPLQLKLTRTRLISQKEIK